MTSLPPLSSEDVPIILEWPETSIGINHTLPCPCGNLSTISGRVNRNAFRFCNGSFITGAVWDAPLQQACNFSATTKKLCQITAVSEHNEVGWIQLVESFMHSYIHECYMACSTKLYLLCLFIQLLNYI